MPSPTWEQIFVGELSRRELANLRRRRGVVIPIDSVRVEVEGRTLVNFASNDYLGLARHPRVIAAARVATEAYGVGSTAAPLICGYTPAHQSAERAIAKWKGTEAAILFSSGYQANLGLIQALAAAGAGAGSRVRFLVDKLAHASLIDAVRAAAGAAEKSSRGAHGVSYRVYPHNGLAKLHRLLVQAPPGLRDVIVTESIFSMDGDAVELQALAALRQGRSDSTMLVLDEAHGSGVYGADGSGLAAELGLTAAVDATVVTLSKAVGVLGAAICGSKDLCDLVENYARSYLFSTSMPAGIAAAAEASIGVMCDEPHRQRRVRHLARFVRRELAANGFELPIGDSPIIPILLGDERKALILAAQLKERDFLVVAIRPPTVPRGGSRLRITLCAEHSDAQIDALLSALIAQAGGKVRPSTSGRPGSDEPTESID